jgi:hypothetical protein
LNPLVSTHKQETSADSNRSQEAPTSSTSS